MYLTRYFKTRNLEIFRLSKEMFGDKVGILTIVDFRRKSTIEDFPYLKGIENEDTFGEENFIKAILLMDYELDKDTKEDVIGVAEGFLGEKENCSWNIDFIKVDFSIDHSSLEDIIKNIENILKEKYNNYIEIKLDKENLKFLSQD